MYMNCWIWGLGAVISCCEEDEQMIAVIDYGVGNLFSVEKALLQFGVKVAVTSDPNVIRQANKLVLPGVGAFGDCMTLLVILLFNSLAKPYFDQMKIEQVDYGTFMNMTTEQQIGKVEIQDNQILFTNKDNSKTYKTGIMCYSSLNKTSTHPCDSLISPCYYIYRYFLDTS